MTNEITSDLIAQRVRRYTPKRLDAAAWNACREAVVQAVLAVRPPTLLEADYYTTHLCLFLASLTRRQWDRVGAPDVRLLLTEAAIEAFTSREGMPGKADNTRKTARTRLRWLHSAVHQVELAPLEPRAASEVARRFWGSVLELSPFTALVAGYERLGHSLHISSWVNLSKELATDLSVLLEQASATGIAAGTVDASRLGAAALRDAVAPQGVIAVTHASNVTSKSQKTVSRAAALRQAKASLVAKPLIADVPELAPELSVMIDGWCPQGVADAIWSPVADVAAIAMAAYAPASTSSIMNIRSIVADYCLWVHARPARSACGDLTAEELLAEGLLEHYFAGPVSERPHATQGTVRSVLRRVVRNLRPGKRPEPIAYTPVQAPYSEAECASFGLLPVGADPDLRPKLTERISIRPANANAIEAALTMIDSLNAANRHVRELLSDREFSYKSEQSWAQPLRQRGVSQVMDLHPNDRGIRDYNGIAMMDGVPYCSAALANRPDLVNIARPERFSAPPLKANASVEEREEHDRVTAQIAEFNRLKSELEQRAFRRVAGPDADGNERYECPAQAGKLICANCPFSLNFLDGVPVVEKPHALPALPVRPVRLDSSATAAEREQYRQDLDRYNTQADFLRCCRQRTITIPGTVTPKTRQKLAWGSEDWQESYKRRTHVEGAFGNWKSPKTSRVQRGWIYVVGLVKTGIMIACVAFATNMRLLRRWSERTGDITDPLTKPLPESLGFEELDADGNLDLADGPPSA